MLDPLMTLLAAKAKAVGLVAGTALVTSALVGGGAVAMTAVSSEKPLTGSSAASSASATPTATIGIGKGKGQGAENRSDTATAVLKGKTPVPTVSFTCDPTKNHGQNVSAYGKTVAKGPGRGRQISAAAKSDCGKKAKTAEADSTASPKPSKSAKPAKPAKAAKPAHAQDKPATAGKPAHAQGKPETAGKPAHAQGKGKPERKDKPRG